MSDSDSPPVDPQRAIPVDALLAQAARLAEEGDLQGAEARYAEVVRRHPDRADGHLGLARVALATGRPAEALRHLPAAAQASPASFDVYELYAFIGIHGGVFDTAIEWLEVGAQHLPREPRLFEYLVRLYAADGRLEDLGECLQHYARLRKMPVRQAALIFTRDGSLTDDLKSRIAAAAGY